MTTTDHTHVSDRVRELVDELAGEVAGADDVARIETVVGLLNVAGHIAQTSSDQRAMVALQELGRRRRQVQRAAPPQPDKTIYSDPTFLANAKLLMRGQDRIVGGEATSDFPDCVAIGGPAQWCCSGTLVRPNVVLTAAHCEAAGCSARVLVGTTTAAQNGGRILNVAEVHVHPDYAGVGTPADLAALVLTQPVEDVEPRAIAPREAVDEAQIVRLVGFGNVDVAATHGYGIKRMVEVPVASADPAFGADPALEFVAGQPFLDRDSCTGDSGGPAYLQVDGAWLLAGATSRATASSVRPCGDGGVYERVHAFEDWLDSIS